MTQTILVASEHYSELDDYITTNSYKRIFLVCGSSIKYLNIGNYFKTVGNRLGVEVIRFSDFTPNPLYDSVVKGVALFNESKCDVIIAVGGGSAMDVAKCIKLYSNMDHSKNYLQQTIIPNDVPVVAVPTTAGTGSEATRFAVIYYEGTKQSVSDNSIIPSTVLFDSAVLKSLSEYHKKSSMLDALCHAIESFWSVNSTDESKKYSVSAIRMIFENLDSYLANEDSGNENMLKAANLAGKAINITQTTAGHAMCYKITSLYNFAHGHAAALCVNQLWPFMSDNADKCIDVRGKEYLKSIFVEIAHAMNCESVKAAQNKFAELLLKLNISKPDSIKDQDFDLLKNSVNPVRLKNNPVELTTESIDYLYHKILGK